MAEIKKYILKDAQGNTLYVQTLAGLVVTEDGSNVQAKLEALQNATTGKTMTYVKENIAARDALTGLNTGDQCWVRDATGDASVTKGAAKYIYDGTAWLKTAEAESMDIVHDWKDIQNKPSSAVADIDDAVLKKHQHTTSVEDIEAAVGKAHQHTSSVEAIDAAVGKAHEHTNTVAEIDAAVDSVQEKASGWDDAASKAHEHGNKAELDAITATGAQINAAAAFAEALEADAAAVDGAVNNAHTHDNKELLDGISADGETVTINGKVFYAKQEVAFIGAGGSIPATLASNGLVFEAIA